MPIYRPTVAAGAMPFLSLNFARPSTPSDAPLPPQSENYSTGSYGRLEFAEAIANYERMYGPVEDYQAPDTDAVMTDDTTQSTGSATGNRCQHSQFRHSILPRSSTRSRERWYRTPNFVS